MQPQIMIVESRYIIREGLKQLLEAEAEAHVITEAATGAEAIRQLHERPCKMLLLGNSDQWHNELPALRQIKAKYPRLPVVLLIIDLKHGLWSNPLAKYVDSCLPMNMDPLKLRQAIRTIRQDQHHRPRPPVTAPLQGPCTNQLRLSARELEVLNLIEQGKTVSQIAMQMNISTKTVSTYRQRLMTKLGCESNGQIILYAQRSDLIRQ